MMYRLAETFLRTSAFSAGTPIGGLILKEYVIQPSTLSTKVYSPCSLVPQISQISAEVFLRISALSAGTLWLFNS